jgi:hypothetical protein
MALEQPLLVHTSLMPVFHLGIFSREANLSLASLATGPCGTNWIKTKEKFASREKIRKWKTGLMICPLHDLCA